MSSPPRRGFTLIDLLLAACVLTILLSMAVSLSRHVRAQSARGQTVDQLAQLERLTGLYAGRNGGKVPEVPDLDDLVVGGKIDDQRALAEAEWNNRAFVAALLRDGGPAVASGLRDMPVSLFDPRTPSVRDAWGTAILFVPGRFTLLGMAPRDDAFFVSAGPDRKFSTREDNLYSYESFRVNP